MSLKSRFFFFIIIYTLFVSCHQQATLFESMPASKTNIDFENKLAEKHLFNILYYLYYYNGGGVAVGDINNDSLPDIYFTANSKGHNKLYLNKGNFEFEDITEKAGVQGLSDWCSGVTMADVNGDGLLDIYVSTISGRYGLQGHNELYINNGNSTFTESSKTYNLNTSCFTGQSVFFDYDHDGDLDCYMLNQSHHPHANVTDTARRREYDALSGDRLYRNELNTGTKNFTDVSQQAGIYQSSLGYGLGISVADINNDGWEDIYVGNDFHENDYYYVNQQNGTFKEEGSKHFGHYSRFSMGNDIADYNNDGQLDIVTVDMLPPEEKYLKTYGSDENADVYKYKLLSNGYQNQYSRNCLQRNNGDGISFGDVALMANIPATDWSWCPLFADFDNDGNKDLFISSGIVKRPVDLDYIKFSAELKAKGMNQTDKFDEEAIDAMPDGSSHPFLYKGNGKFAFEDVSKTWGTAEMKGYYNGAAYADLDNDGDLDLVINSLDAPAVIMKNNSPAKNYLSVVCKGNAFNTAGIGTKVYLFIKDSLQYQQLMLTRGFQSASDTRLHFGLNNHAVIDSMLVVWPDQQYQVIKNVSVNKTATVLQKDAAGIFDNHIFFPAPKQSFDDITNLITCNWKHKENDFTDFNIQYLIPHEQSTRGPKIAVADVNKDGLEDFYVCGAKQQAGALMIQQPGKSFNAGDTALFNRYALAEDVDAAFFDANGDGAPDLWVVSGGNEPPANNTLYADRLYLNDGKGHFSNAEKAIPTLYENKSCISVADIDKDGDADVFVGTLSNINAYGIPQTSHLLLNDGKGGFSQANKNIIGLDSMGMVTTASFADLNKDGWPDLIVSGEWMPLKIFINEKGKFSEKDIAGSTGLWQTVYPADVNDDGYMDLLAGNWGHNSKLWSGKQCPLKLYVKDFDKNNSVEQVMCYTMDGGEYTFLAKDELERAMPILKKAYLKYDEVAGKNVQYMFFDLFKDYRELKAETLGSALFINDGKGNFQRNELPDALQMAPLMCFAGNSNTYVAAGNFYGTIPYEGRYDAMVPTTFAFDKNTNSETISILPAVRSEARDAKWIRLGDSIKVLILASNNDALRFLLPVNDK